MHHDQSLTFNRAKCGVCEYSAPILNVLLRSNNRRYSNEFFTRFRLTNNFKSEGISQTPCMSSFPLSSTISSHDNRYLQRVIEANTQRVLSIYIGLNLSQLTIRNIMRICSSAESTKHQYRYWQWRPSRYFLVVQIILYTAA